MAVDAVKVSRTCFVGIFVGVSQLPACLVREDGSTLQLQMRDADQKERERRIIEMARRQSALFPAGQLLMNDKPDGRIASASLGIEVSELFPEKQDGALFSGPQVSAFQSKVVSAAEHCYRARSDARPVDVLVVFQNEWSLKREPNEMGRALAEFVHGNYPASDTVLLGELDQDVHGWVDGLAFVRIWRVDGGWEAAGCNDIAPLSYKQVASRIAEKNQRVTDYRAHLPGWKIWLLLTTRINVLCSVWIPAEVTSWRFSSAFDRILLAPWYGGVLELNTTRQNEPTQGGE